LCNYDKQFFAVSQSEKQWDAVGKGSFSDNKKEILNSMNGEKTKTADCLKTLIL